MTAATEILRPTVFLVDDDPAMRDSVSMMLEGAGWPVRTYADGGSFLADDPGDRAGCVVLDYTMPRLTGLQVQQALLDRGSRLPVIFLTAHGTVPMAVAAVQHGALAVLEKPVDGDHLIDCVGQALARDRAQREARTEKSGACAAFERLTPREREVMALMTDGLTNKEIGQRLNVSYRTVEIHRAHVLRKMGAPTLAQLIRLADECAGEDEGKPSLPGTG